MAKSYKQLHLGTYFGIPVFVHWTFLFFILFILYTAYNLEFNAADTFWYLAFVGMLFFFVVLHEYGHALMAKKFGVGTKDIIISPIGGIARLNSIPQNPSKELKIALAGPAVNVGLATFFLLIVICIDTTIWPQSPIVNLYKDPVNYIKLLLFINITLAIFNMLPAFPMDGGRVLRALLCFKFPRVKATYIAMIIAQIMAVVFLLIAFYNYHFVLLLIAGFIFITSRSEYLSTVNSFIFKTSTAKDAIILNPISFYENDKISDLQSKVSPLQSSFMIYDETDRLLGAIPSPILKNANPQLKLQSYIGPHHGSVQEDISLDNLFSIMNDRGWYLAQVMDKHNKAIGIIDRSSIENFVKSRKRTKDF